MLAATTPADRALVVGIVGSFTLVSLQPRPTASAARNTIDLDGRTRFHIVTSML
jgi:hypothetical protein